MKFRKIYFDGCNGWCCGRLCEHEVKQEETKHGTKIYIETEYKEEDGEVVIDRNYSRNDEYLFEDEQGDILYVPCEEIPI